MACLTKFEIADVRALFVARHYYEETQKPFLVSVGKFSGWDCRSTDDTMRIEVKFETTPERTGNVCIEYWNSHLDQPSGVLGTSANLWLHIIPDNGGFTAIEYEIPKLQKLVIETGYLRTNGHDSLFKIIPIDVFQANAKRTFKFETKVMEALPSPQ